MAIYCFDGIKFLNGIWLDLSNCFFFAVFIRLNLLWLKKKLKCYRESRHNGTMNMINAIVVLFALNAVASTWFFFLSYMLPPSPLPPLLLLLLAAVAVALLNPYYLWNQQNLFYIINVRRQLANGIHTIRVSIVRRNIYDFIYTSEFHPQLPFLFLSSRVLVRMGFHMEIGREIRTIQFTFSRSSSPMNEFRTKSLQLYPLCVLARRLPTFSQIRIFFDVFFLLLLFFQSFSSFSARFSFHFSFKRKQLIKCYQISITVALLFSPIFSLFAVMRIESNWCWVNCLRKLSNSGFGVANRIERIKEAIREKKTSPWIICELCIRFKWVNRHYTQHCNYSDNRKEKKRWHYFYGKTFKRPPIMCGFWELKSHAHCVDRVF